MTTTLSKTPGQQNSPVNGVVLVIVDMQPGFHASQDSATIAAVKAQILQAIEQKQLIIVLEYAKYPATDERLREDLEGYDRCVYRTKLEDDGSDEVIDACIEHELSACCFRFCGVNTHWCVQSTVVGLAAKLDESRIEVLKSACNDDMGNDWPKFELRGNVILV